MNKPQRNAAQKRAGAAIEFLYSIVEYFPEEQNNDMGQAMSQRQRPEAIQFTVKALQAARREIDGYLSFFGEDLVAESKENAGTPPTLI